MPNHRQDRTIEPDTDQGFLPFAERVAEMDGTIGIGAQPDTRDPDRAMAIVAAEDKDAAKRIETEANFRGLESESPFDPDDAPGVGVPVRDPQQRQSDEAFFEIAGGGMSPDLRAVGFERQEPTGRFAPAGTRPDGSVPPDRAPDGRFVSPDREPIEDIGRRSDDGLFDLF